MTNTISFNVNNGRQIKLIQRNHDGSVLCTTGDHSPIDERNDLDIIPAGDMVMLLNLYRYIKRNDIRNDFINPNGKNKED